MAAYNVPVLINGAQIGGLAAAAQLADRGYSSVVVEPSNNIGGFTTGGLGAQDYNGREFRNPLIQAYYADIIAQLEAAYGTSPGWAYFYGDSASLNKPKFTPSIARKALTNIILTPARMAKITIIKNVWIDEVTVIGAVPTVKLSNGDTVTCKIGIEASYEQILARKSGASMTHGVESSKTYKESGGGIITRVGTELSNRSVRDGSGNIFSVSQLPPAAPDFHPDTALQEFVFRMTFASGDNRMIFQGHGPNGEDSFWPKPVNSKGRAYRESDFAWCKNRYGTTTAISTLSSFQQVGTDLYAANGPTIPGLANKLAGVKSKAEYDALWQDAFYQQAGMYYWAAWSPDSTSALKASMNTYGLPKNENQAEGEYFGAKGFSAYWYIREGFRLIARRVIDQNYTTDTALAKSAPDSLNLGGYPFDRHATTLFPMFGPNSRFGGAMSELGLNVKTFYIGLDHCRPVKGQADWLLCATGFGTSGAATGPIRIEPIYQSLGDTMGIIAARMLDLNVLPADVSYAQLQPALAAASVVTSY